MGLPDYGGLDLNFLGTYTGSFVIQGAPGTPADHCAGLYGVTCGIPQPKFKAKTRLTWTTPLHGFQASLDWRYIGSVNVDTGATGTADSHIPEYSYFDVSMQYRFKDRYTFRVGCNNLFDIDPPVIGSGEGGNNANTYPQIYDPLGRYIFMGVTADF
jgi:outer membrane receptor protein involved in Fe transport